jgi:hypothetical protein
LLGEGKRRGKGVSSRVRVRVWDREGGATEGGCHLHGSVSHSLCARSGSDRERERRDLANEVDIGGSYQSTQIPPLGEAIFTPRPHYSVYNFKILFFFFGQLKLESEINTPTLKSTPLIPLFYYSFLI